MFRLRVSNLKYDVDDTLEVRTFEFLKTIGFLGLDNDSITIRKRTEIGINIFSKCFLSKPKKGWTTTEIADELGVSIHSVYSPVKWLRELNFLTEDFPGRVEEPKRIRVWHYDVKKAWKGVETQAKICIENYRECIMNISKVIVKEGAGVGNMPARMEMVEKDEKFDFTLREMKVFSDPYNDLEEMMFSIGLVKQRRDAKEENKSLRILYDCFLMRTDRVWTAEQVAKWVEVTKPTAYRIINRLLALGFIGRCRARDGGSPSSAFYLQGGDVETSWSNVEKKINLCLLQYKKMIDGLVDSL